MRLFTVCSILVVLGWLMDWRWQKLFLAGIVLVTMVGRDGLLSRIIMPMLGSCCLILFISFCILDVSVRVRLWCVVWLFSICLLCGSSADVVSA